MTAREYGEQMLASFFQPGGVPFYTEFRPSAGTTSVAPSSPVGRALLGVLGLKLNFSGKVVPTDETADVYVGSLMLLRRGDTFFAGYWDGDGVAVVGSLRHLRWASTSDVKCAHDWRAIPADPAVVGELAERLAS